MQCASYPDSWTRRESQINHDTFAGLEYDTDVVSSRGVAVTLFVPPNTTRQQIAAAKRVARNRRDVVAFYIEKVPVS
jgi:hypothetical protein